MRGGDDCLPVTPVIESASCAQAPDEQTSGCPRRHPRARGASVTTLRAQQPLNCGTKRCAYTLADYIVPMAHMRVSSDNEGWLCSSPVGSRYRACARNGPALQSAEADGAFPRA